MVVPWSGTVTNIGGGLDSSGLGATGGTVTALRDGIATVSFQIRDTSLTASTSISVYIDNALRATVYPFADASTANRWIFQETVSGYVNNGNTMFLEVNGTITFSGQGNDNVLSVTLI